MDRDPWPNEFRRFRGTRYGEHWRPAVDVFDTADAVVIRVELPGVSASDVRVKVEAEIVRVSGERKVVKRGDLVRLHQVEIESGRFERAIRVETDFDRASITAHLEDGFLEITLPTKSSVRRQVEVETE